MAPVRGTRAARASGGPRAGPIPTVAARRGGRVMRKREPRWQSAAERARVAAELLEEAESLTETSTIATPADVRRAGLPPPIRVELPPEPAVPLPMAPAAEPPPVPPSLDGALADDPENVPLLVERAHRLNSSHGYISYAVF